MQRNLKLSPALPSRYGFFMKFPLPAHGRLRSAMFQHIGTPRPVRVLWIAGGWLRHASDGEKQAGSVVAGWCVCGWLHRLSALPDLWRLLAFRVLGAVFGSPCIDHLGEVLLDAAIADAVGEVQITAFGEKLIQVHPQATVIFDLATITTS